MHYKLRHDRSQTLKSDEAKWSKQTKIILVGSFWGEIPMILRKSDEAMASSASVVATAMSGVHFKTTTVDSLIFSSPLLHVPQGSLELWR